MWDPRQYLRYGDERARPFHDLLARVPLAAPRRVVDLGCGPGNLTAVLAARWPQASVVGVDSSEEMLAAASADPTTAGIEFVRADVHDWVPEAEVDLIVSNATLQWLPGHLALLPGWAAALAPGGCLAVQVPGNFEAPSHTILRELRESPRWAPQLAVTADRALAVHRPDEYVSALTAAGLHVDVWETTYLHVLTGDDPVLEWVRGTALRPVLTALADDDRAEFVDDYGRRLRAAYPPAADGSTVFPFRRIFFVGRRPGTARVSSLVGLHHVQLAMPAGEEESARAFYVGILGLVEVPKPPILATRGGAWFRGPGVELHLGVEAAFRPAAKAHPGLVSADLDELAARLVAAGRDVAWDDGFPGHRRFYTSDPFGNRIELLHPA